MTTGLYVTYFQKLRDQKEMIFFKGLKANMSIFAGTKNTFNPKLFSFRFLNKSYDIFVIKN